MIIDLPDSKDALKIYIDNLINTLDKGTYPTGKRTEIRYMLNKAREKFRKIKK